MASKHNVRTRAAEGANPKEKSVNMHPINLVAVTNTKSRAGERAPKTRKTADPAVEAFERWQRANRAHTASYSRLEIAEEKYWAPYPGKMPHSCCIFPDDQRDSKRQEYDRRYMSARKKAGLQDFDKAREKATKEYWAATAALAKSRASTLQGVNAKAKWLARNIPYGTTEYDGQMVRSLAADLDRL